MEHCFELFGLDFIVEMENGHMASNAPCGGNGGMTKPRVYILEVNPGPDFKQTGDRLKEVIEGLLENTCSMVLGEKQSASHSNVAETVDNTNGQFIPVYDKEWSVSRMQLGVKMI